MKYNLYIGVGSVLVGLAAGFATEALTGSNLAGTVVVFLVTAITFHLFNY